MTLYQGPACTASWRRRTRDGILLELARDATQPMPIGKLHGGFGVSRTYYREAFDFLPK